MSLMTNLVDKWEMMDPDQQRKWKIGLAVLALLFIAIFVQKISKKDVKQYKKTTVESKMMLPSNKSLDMENLHAEVYRLDQELKRTKAQQAEQEAAIAKRIQSEMTNQQLDATIGDPATMEELAKMRAELDALKGEQNNAPGQPRAKGVTRPRLDMAAGLPSPHVNAQGAPTLDGQLGAPEAAFDAGNMPNTGVDDAVAPMEPAKPTVGLRLSSGGKAPGESIGGAASNDGATSGGPAATGGVPAVSATTKQEEPQVYIPGGTIIQGVMLTGLDAPTASHAQKNPTPVLVRIQHEAILPNRFKVDIKECFMILSGYGVMSTERANLRAESISCVRKDGGVIESQIQGYAVGNDGRAGLRGRLVTKQGAMIARAMTAGFFSGLANAAKPTAIAAVNTNPTSTTGYQTPDFENMLASGIGDGAATALNQVAKFYLDMAKEMFPVIEVDAGRDIEVILVKGTGLQLKAKPKAKGQTASRR